MENKTEISQEMEKKLDNVVPQELRQIILFETLPEEPGEDIKERIVESFDKSFGMG